MPTYPLTLPPSPVARAVRVDIERKAAVSESPLTGQEQVFDWGVSVWHLTLEFPPVREADVAAWHQFFYDLRGRVGTFSFDLTRYVKSTPAPGVVLFRVVDSMQGWDVSLAKNYGFAITARQAL